ncbi:AzlD domain-containing protein [Haloarculaceae archaeon H-GB2-1]|nr:AzlD domain-containing protein [Haloarculaceae archaeon H-GB1-1]MEA5408483.1 AzlD domain-containing protein [Haloarculaceae archaeon H-GB2-1]
MTTSYGTGAIWLAIVGAGVGTFAIRLSFILLLGRLDEAPPTVEGILRFVPAAVLAALVAPSLVALSAEPSLGLSYAPEKVGAGAIAAVVAWRTENVLATIGVGMAALWTLQVVV